jgi:hypothetical protein
MQEPIFLLVAVEGVDETAPVKYGADHCATPDKY